MIKWIAIVLAVLAGSANAQVTIGDTQMTAWRQLRGFGLNLDSVMVGGKVRTYTADSIRISGMINHVTIHLDDSQRVSRMIFKAHDIDSARFFSKYELLLSSPRVTQRFDTRDIIWLKLVHDNHIVDLMYDRKLGYIREEDYPHP